MVFVQETCSSQQSQMQQDLGRATSTLGCYQSVLARLQAEAPAHENLMHDRQVSSQKIGSHAWFDWIPFFLLLCFRGADVIM